jgi:hypothetical protein
MGTLLIILLGLLMAKLTLNTIGSRYGSIDALNDNSDLVETAFENTLSRDGTGPNNMESDLDMDSNSILNADTVNADSLRTDALFINDTLVVPGSLSGATNASAVQYDPAGTGATSTTVQAKLRETVSVTDFGAVGNGTSDDTTAIQTAITQAAAAGKSLFFPNGTYLISSLTVPANSYLYGESQEGVILRKTGTTDVNLITCSGGNQVIRQMTLDNMSVTRQQILSLGNGSDILVSRVTFLNASLQRWTVRGDWNIPVSNIEVSDCYFENCLYGCILFLATVEGHKNITMSRNTFTNCGSTIIGLHSQTTKIWAATSNVDVSYNKMINLANTGAYGPLPIEIWGVYGFTCIGNYVDSGTRGLTGGGWNINGVLSNNTVMNQTLYGVEAGPSINMEVSNNTFLNCRTAISFTDSVNQNYVENYRFVNNVIMGGPSTYTVGFDCVSTFAAYPYKNIVISGNNFYDPTFLRTVIRVTASQEAPIITFAGSGTGAIASATLKAISGRAIYGGRGYTAPTLTVDGGDGSGMSLTATVTDGAITAVNVVSAGTGYTTEPTIMVTDATGTGAILDLSMGIDAVTIINGGSGYVSPTVTITNNGGVGFTGTVTESSGVITGVTVTAPGNYFGREGVVEISDNHIQLKSQYSAETGINVTGGKVQVKNNYILSDRHLANLVGAQGFFLISIEAVVTNGTNNPIFDVSNNTIICTNTYDGAITAYYAIGNVSLAGKYYGHIIRDNYIEGNFRGGVIVDTSNADPIIFNNNTINTTLTGTYSRKTSYSNTILTASATAAPVAGTWRRGDIVKNSTPTVGQPQGWVCTVAGTPGTWVSQGNL